MSRMGAAAEGGNPLLLQSRTAQEPAPLKFPPRDLPKPPPLTQADRELVERSRFLSETLKYSGYYVVPSPSSTRLLQQHSLVSSSFAPSISNGGAAGSGDQPPQLVQQIYTPIFERYSDRYRKILGKKTFFHEISNPNPHLFPPELLSAKTQIHSTSTFTSKVHFLSSKTLANEVARLVAAGSTVQSNDVGDERMDRDGAGGEDGLERKRGDEADGEEEEEMEEQEMEEEDSDLEGDYGANYVDDDEDGMDAFGDDGDEGEVF